ncbi:C-GCAxxG-C-C family protein [Eubacteriales bacterium OttesenSCG-928-K08]|nr:C-GCAxxG-C-C family protein [Eubacteriales bacterium OttesenSCG-928-K08]
MLYDYMKNEFLYKEDWNCAEHILIGANRVYKLGLDANAIKVAAGFGGGISTGDICGALTGAVMALGLLFVEERAHESNIKSLTAELINRYSEKMGAIDCQPLKDRYHNDEIKCRDVILEAASILDSIVLRERPELFEAKKAQ